MYLTSIFVYNREQTPQLKQLEQQRRLNPIPKRAKPSRIPKPPRIPKPQQQQQQQQTAKPSRIPKPPRIPKPQQQQQQQQTAKPSRIPKPQQQQQKRANANPVQPAAKRQKFFHFHEDGKFYTHYNGSGPSRVRTLAIPVALLTTTAA